MRLQTILGLILLTLALPSSFLGAVITVKADAPGAAASILSGKDPFTDKKAGDTVSGSYDLNEMMVDKLDGTIMVSHSNGSKPSPLETLSTVEKGDVLTVYDKSWVILKDHKGDRIGLDSGTAVVVDEFYIQGPDRQIRLVLQKGILLLKVSGCGSRQSFFEVNSGSVVSSINDSQSVLGYDDKKDDLRVQYFWGKMTVIDKDNEQKLKNEYTEHNWEKGKMLEEEPIPVDELDRVNFNRFFSADPRLEAPDNNMLLRGNY